MSTVMSDSVAPEVEQPAIEQPPAAAAAVEQPAAPAAPAKIKACHLPRTPAQTAALIAANQRRAQEKEARSAARIALEEKAKETLMKRFGAAAVENALGGPKRRGRPSFEAERVRDAQSRLVERAAAGEDIDDASEDEVEDEQLDDFVTRLAIAHLRRRPEKRRALEEAVDNVVRARLEALTPPAAAAPAAPQMRPPSAPAPAKRAVVLL